MAHLITVLAADYKSSTIKKSREVLAMVLDHAGLEPNRPVIDR